MTNDEPFDIDGDPALRAAVRDETQYDDTTLSGDDLGGLIDSGKRILALRTGKTEFYDQRGLAVALLGVVSAKAKGAVENSPVRVKNVGPDDVTFRDSDGGSLQLAHYEEMTQLGLSQANTPRENTQNIVFTNDYLHGDPSRES